MPNIAIVWDFDGTLTPQDSTSKTIEVISGEQDSAEFWAYIKYLRGDHESLEWSHILASDAPIWMYSLSRLAAERKIPLNKQFFKEFVFPNITLFENVVPFLKKIKSLQNKSDFKKLDIKINHFIVSAGLKDLIELVFPKNLITWTFGCRYKVVVHPDHKNDPESIPVFCMDETVKTRSLFEISKGSFNEPTKSVNTRVKEEDYWAPFKNFIYIGDGDTDIPSLSLVRSKGGMGIAVYDKNKPVPKIKEKLKTLTLDKRTDLITPADYSLESELFNFIATRCLQIRQRYDAEKPL